MDLDELLRILRADVVEAARAMLGFELVSVGLRARIVETEAYRADDPASHSFRGRTPRNAPMYGEPGRAYVYFSYGCHWMLNVVAHAPEDAAAILIRAAEPLMQTNESLSGPGKLARAFGITGADNGIDLFAPASPLRIERPTIPPPRVVAGPRVGIAVGKGHETLWRFADAARLRFASRPRPGGG